MWVSDSGDYVIENVECEGEELLEQAKMCHYDNEHSCAAPINVTSISNDSNHLCTCKFQGGKKVCCDCKLFYYAIIHVCTCSIVC